MATLRDLIPGFDPTNIGAAVPGSVPSVQRVLRGPQTSDLEDQHEAAGMGQLRRGFASGQLGAEANAMAADESSLRAQGRAAEADALRSRIGAVQQRAATFAPKEQDVTQLGWEPGRILDYGLGAVGQGTASMLEPAGAAAGLGAASQVLGAIPTAPTRLLGGALRLAAPAAAGYLNFRQAKGEFYNDAVEDPAAMAGKTPEEINTAANKSGVLAGAFDTILPGLAAERMVGRQGLKALAKMPGAAKVGLDLAGEGATEVAQGEIKRHFLSDLNPLRDTSKDSTERWNDLAGGILGAGPISAASHVMANGHKRLGVEDDPNNDVSGKAKPDAEPKTGGSFTDVLKRGAQERKDKRAADDESGANAWRNELSASEIEGDDYVAATQNQHAALVKELESRVSKGEAGAQEHLDAMRAQDPNDPMFPVDSEPRMAARDFLIGDGSDDTHAEKLLKAYQGRKLNTQMGYNEIGRKVAADELGGKAGAGEAIKPNDPARADAIAKYRELGQRARLASDVMAKALPEAKKKFGKVAAALGQEMAHFAADDYQKPTAGDTARVLRMGASMVSLYGGAKAHDMVVQAGRAAGIEGTKLFKTLNASVSVAREDVGAYQKAQTVSREAAADQLVKALPPAVELKLRKDGVDLTDPDHREHLLGMVEDSFDGTGMSEEAMTKTLGKETVDALREVIGQPIEPRKKRVGPVEEQSDAADAPETKTPAESDENTGDAGLNDESDSFAIDGAKKSMDRAPGARQYFFHGRSTPADGASARNPFAASGKNGLPTLATLDRTDHDGVNSLQRLESNARELLGFAPPPTGSTVRRGKGMRDGRKIGIVQRKGDADTNQDARHETNVVSAKSVMDYSGMQDSKRGEIFDSYLEKDGHKPGARAAIQALDEQIADLIAKTPKIKISAGKTTRNPEYVKLEALKAERWGLIKDLAAATDVRKNAVSGKDELGRDIRERDTVADVLSQDSTAADLVNAYFEDRHLVVADEVGTKDHLRMVLGKLREMTLRGERDIAFAAKVAKENGKTPAEKEAIRKSVEADMNLIRFKTSFTKGGDVAVRASAIVAWVRENKIEYDKPDRKTADSEAIDFRNALMSGISAMLADGFMEGMPHMKDADGKVQKFGEGERKFPDTLKLGTLTQAALVQRAKAARDKIIAADAKLTPQQRHKQRESDRRAAATRVAAEQGTDPKVDHDKGVPDEFRHPGAERGKGDEFAPSSPQDELFDFPGERGAAAAERRREGDPKKSGERFWDAPEQEDQRQDRDRVPTEAEREQRPGAMPTDYTDTTMRSSVMNTERDVPTLTAENAMAKAKGYAEALLGALRKDTKAGLERIERVARMMDAPRWVAGESNQTVGGKFYAAPLAHLLTPKLVKAHPELAAVRSHVADVLTKTDQGAMTGAQKIVLAKALNGERTLDAAEAAERKRAAELGQTPLSTDPRDHLLTSRRVAGPAAAEAFLENLAWDHRKAMKAERLAKEKAAAPKPVVAKVEAKATPAPAPATESVAGVTVTEHPSPNYGPRTKHNADSAGLTVAIASDFTTAGEKLTARVSEGKYLGIPLDVEPAKAGLRLAKAMRAAGATTLNVAGNGIYTLAKSGKTQAQINQHVYDTIAAAHALLPITKIVTGGQTGVDIAGAIAAKALGIPTVVTMPGGFKQRGVDQKDVSSTAAGVTKQIVDGAAALKTPDQTNVDEFFSAVAESTAKLNPMSAAEKAQTRYSLARAGMSSSEIEAAIKDMEGTESTAGRKLNAQTKPMQQLTASTVQAVAQTRSLMRLLGFKAAPAQFADVAEKLLTDPGQDPAAFIKQSAQALSHLLIRRDNVKQAMKGVAWAQERQRLIAKLTAEGMGRIAAQEQAFQTLVGEVLAEELKARTTAERMSSATIFGAAKSFVSSFKKMTATNEFTEVVRNELNKLIEQANNPERLKEGFAKVTFQEAVDGDPQAAAVLAHMAANPNAILTGSIVLSLSGSVYRNAKNMLHDLDFVVKGTHAAMLAHLDKAFPNSVQVNGFTGSAGTVYTHIVPPPGAKIVGMTYKGGKATYTIERDGVTTGRAWYEGDTERKEGERGTTVDFFVDSNQDAAQIVPFTTGGKTHNVRVTSAGSIFEKKMEMARPKDMLDFTRYVPEAGRKLNSQTTPAGVQAAESTPDQTAIDEARAYVTKVLGPKVKVEFLKVFDAAGEWIDAENLMKLSLASGPGLLTVAHHESMHALWGQLIKNHPDAASKLAYVMSSPDIRARLEGMLHDEPEALKALSDPEERVAYAYQFWAAGMLDVDKPATTMFAKLRKFLRKVFGMVRDSETALDIMTAFHEGKLAEPSAAGRAIEKIMARETWNEDVKRKFDGIIQHLHSSTMVSGEVLRSSESETAQRLADMMFSNPGRAVDGENPEGYLNARTRVVRQYTNFLYQAVKKLSPRDMEAAVNYLQNPDTKLEDIHYAPVREAVKDIRALTKRYYNYATRDAGMNLEYLGDNHFPRVWDVAQLVEKRDQFIAMVLQPKYAKTMEAALKIANRDPKKPQQSLQDIAALMHEEMVRKNGVDEKGMEAERDDNDVLSPFFASQKERSFKWLDAEDVKPFLEKDLIGAMSRYLHQGIRAAEYTRRFGNGGLKLRAMVANKGEMFLEENDQGAMVENRSGGKIYHELVAAAKEKKIEGVEAEKWVARRMEDIKNSVAAHEGSLGSASITPLVRKFSSAAMAYQNLRLLPFSLFAAFADPLSLAARGPGVKAGFDAFTQGLKDVWARWKDAASDMPAERQRSVFDDMAETAGVVDSHMFLEQIGKAHTSEFMTDFARKSNRTLFMANGLTAWDRSMRVTATKYAALFLQDHKGLPDKDSARWLKELGLEPKDIPLDVNGKLIYDRHVLAASRFKEGMSDEAKGAALEQATREIEKVHFAITRWVEGAVLTPNAAQRPTWGSDPRWAVLFHLKQFTYSFQDTVLRRAFAEASQGNMNPIGALAASVPTMMVSDILKGFVMGGGSLPPYMKTWGLGDHLMHGVSRAGLGGVSQFGVDALKDPASLAGPTVEQFAKVVFNPGELGKNVVDAIPGARFLGPVKDLGRAVD